MLICITALARTTICRPTEGCCRCLRMGHFRVHKTTTECTTTNVGGFFRLGAISLFFIKSGTFAIWSPAVKCCLFFVRSVSDYGGHHVPQRAPVHQHPNSMYHQTTIMTRSIFSGQIEHVVRALPAELGRLTTPTKRGSRVRNQTSSNSKFRRALITQQLFMGGDKKKLSKNEVYDDDEERS